MKAKKIIIILATLIPGIANTMEHNPCELNDMYREIGHKEEKIYDCIHYACTATFMKIKERTRHEDFAHIEFPCYWCKETEGERYIYRYAGALKSHYRNKHQWNPKTEQVPKTYRLEKLPASFIENPDYDTPATPATPDTQTLMNFIDDTGFSSITPNHLNKAD